MNETQAARKKALRAELRQMRRDHVAALPDATRALIMRRPPAPMLTMIGDDAVIGLYHAAQHEAPTRHYARFFQEAGHRIALPAFTGRDAPMDFREWTDPWDDGDLGDGPFGMAQPMADAAPLVPDVLIVPLVGFTATGDRLGQGGGHYDRWLAAHRDTLAIGMAWDVQEVEILPTEPHDRPLDAVITPTRFFGPFAKVRP
ncbi:5-formyltetrahydrofolate cyclo-ligase [uncultured Croceicoccus sp.]|uniref:5-formyltetrahydrofolate cyclo-ligase n=1 Tax=uncultured Croceicoccus sp. TaxID=1295329 RepID=UPI00260F7AD9|nr:5-formyltetrahydrofolate cyclo-ligase [uncultured Croceicoccus sp.]